MFKVRITAKPLDLEVLEFIKDEGEKKGALEVSSRSDTVSLIISGGSGELLGYAVFGQDDQQMVTIYYARSLLAGLGPIVMKQMFGVSQVLGVPLRVHVSSIKDIQRKARGFGANFAVEGEDADGNLMGIFDVV